MSLRELQLRLKGRIMKDKEQTKKYALILGLQLIGVAVILAIDLITKHFVYGAHAENGSTTVAIKGVLEFTSAQNTGASFGFFEGSVLALGIVSLIASIAIAVVMVMSVKLKNGLLATSLAFILGGALGNMVDRLFLGYVRDFIHLPFMKFFGVFNIADNALTIGVVLIVIYLIFFYSSDMKKLSDAKIAADNAAGDVAEITSENDMVNTTENTAENVADSAVNTEDSAAVEVSEVKSDEPYEQPRDEAKSDDRA